MYKIILLRQMHPLRIDCFRAQILKLRHYYLLIVLLFVNICIFWIYNIIYIYRYTYNFENIQN